MADPIHTQHDTVADHAKRFDTGSKFHLSDLDDFHREDGREYILYGFIFVVVMAGLAVLVMT